MKSIHMNYGSIHVIVYPTRGTGVMLLPGTFLTNQDQSDDYEDCVEALAYLGFQPELDPEIVPAIVGNIECIRVHALE